MQDSGDADTAAGYGETQPEFGGLFFAGDQLIVLFTGNLDRHRQAIADRVGHLDQVTVRQATRTWADIEKANRRLQHRLLRGTNPVLGVTGVGIAISGDEFVISVNVDPDNGGAVEAVRSAAFPEIVSITHRGRPRRGGGR